MTGLAEGIPSGCGVPTSKMPSQRQESKGYPLVKGGVPAGFVHMQAAEKGEAAAMIQARKQQAASRQADELDALFADEDEDDDYDPLAQDPEFATGDNPMGHAPAAAEEEEAEFEEEEEEDGGESPPAASLGGGGSDLEDAGERGRWWWPGGRLARGALPGCCRGRVWATVRDSLVLRARYVCRFTTRQPCCAWLPACPCRRPQATAKQRQQAQVEAEKEAFASGCTSRPGRCAFWRQLS